MVRIQLKLGIMILAAGFSVAALRAQPQAPDQSNQDQQPEQGQQQGQQQGQDQQPNQNQGDQQPQTQAPDQNSQPQQPIPAYRSPLGGAAGNEEDNSAPPQYEPDNLPLAGVQDLSIGVPGGMRSYWQPYLSVLGTGDSLGGGGNGGWIGYESVIGGLNLERISRASDLDLRYIGGGSFYTGNGGGNSVVQDFGVTESMHWRRNTLTLADVFGYFPETSFGYGGSIGLPGLTSITGGLQTVFLPGESILTAEGQRISNASVGQLDLGLSARSSFTLVGGYSLLRFLDNNLLDYSSIITRAGYNYKMTRHDTIGGYYQFVQIRYTAAGTIENHNVHVAYGHQVTGRLAFDVAAGPEISLYPDSVIAGGSPTNSTTHLSWSMNAGLNYQKQEHTSLGVTYSHGLSGGSGVFFGAESDRVSGSVEQRLQRLDLRFTGGYAHNTGLTVAGLISSGQAYNYWFGGANLDRSLSPQWGLRLSYELQYQYSNVAFCVTPQCSTSFTRNVVTLGVNWKGRPFPF